MHSYRCPRLEDRFGWAVGCACVMTNGLKGVQVIQTESGTGKTIGDWSASSSTSLRQGTRRYCVGKNYFMYYSKYLFKVWINFHTGTNKISCYYLLCRQQVTQYDVPFMTETLRQELLELYLYRIDPYPYYYEPVPSTMMPMPRPPLPRELQDNRPRK